MGGITKKKYPSEARQLTYNQEYGTTSGTITTTFAVTTRTTTTTTTDLPPVGASPSIRNSSTLREDEEDVASHLHLAPRYIVDAAASFTRGGVFSRHRSVFSRRRN